jgi:RNA polymerase sigma-70 factor (ECF subfamily)
MSTSEQDVESLLRRARDGDSDARGMLFSRYQDRLRRMIRLRMDRRLQGRLDASDVLQDAYLEFSKSLADYLRQQEMPIYLWLRMITGRMLHTLHRRHLGAEMRDAGREVSLHRREMPSASSICLSEQIVARLSSPSMAAMRTELRVKIEEALNEMDELDREVLALRHFERLSNVETARVLNLSTSAASKRYVRALRRMKTLLIDFPLVEESEQKPEGLAGR